MKIFASVLLLWALIPFSICSAQSVPVKTVPYDSVCVSPADAVKVVIGLESEADLKRQIPLMRTITEEIRTQRDLALESAAAQEKKAEAAIKVAEAANKALENSKQLAEIEEENCKKKVEAATPSFWHRLGTHAAALGIGGIIAAVLVLVL